MRLYLDTGFFVDYESGRSALTKNLRTTGRGGRGLLRVQEDAETVYNKLRRHDCYTNALTLIEYEDIHHRALRELVKAAAYSAQRTREAAKLSISSLLSNVCQPGKIHIIPLNKSLTLMVSRDNSTRLLDLRDAIHLRSALDHHCEMVISTDADMKKFDRRFSASGSPLRIIDTNIAKNLV